MIIRKTDSRGSVLIEYIIILAFIGALATAFVFDKAFNDTASDVIEDVKYALGFGSGRYTSLISDKSNLLKDFYLDGQSKDDTYNDKYQYVFSIVGDNNALFELENGTYEVVVDREKLQALGIEKGIENIEDNLWTCVLLYNNKDGTGKATYDTGARYISVDKGDQTGKDSTTHIITDKTSTIRFDVNDSTGKYLGINIARENGNKNNVNDTLNIFGDNYKDLITLKKVN